MTVKEFFKSNAFKCIAVLFSILLVCGVILTIAYGFMEVTAEEKLSRAITKIYGQEVITSEVDLSSYETSQTSYTVNNMYYIEDDENYLLNVKGKNGYGGGYVVCWVVVETSEGAVSGIGAVTIDSNSGQSFIGKITDADLARFSEEYKDGIVYQYGYDDAGGKAHEEYIATGASASYRAICNAVNGAVTFTNTYLSGGNA